MSVTVPEAPASLTVEQVKSLFNLKTDEDAARVFDLAVSHVNRAFAGAFRTVEPVVYDDAVRRVAGAIVGAGKRPAGGNGQLTTVEQPGQQQLGMRDYLAPIRHTLAQYVVPL